MSQESNGTAIERHALSVSIEGERETLIFECGGAITVAEMLVEIGTKHGRDFRAFSVSLEDTEERAGASTLVCDLVRRERRGRLHLHQCRQAEVTVEYNNRDHTRPFSPSHTVQSVLEWAVSAKVFNVADDIHDLELQVAGTTTPLTSNTHIGSLVQQGHCALKLDMIAKDRPQG